MAVAGRGELVAIRELLETLEEGLTTLELPDLLPFDKCLIASPTPSSPGNDDDEVEFTSPLVPVAATAYCRTLLAGIAALLENQQARLTGILLRSLYETWLVGLYCMLGGLEAMERLLKARDHRLIPLDDAFGLTEGAQLGPGQYLSVKKLAQLVDKLVSEQPKLGLSYDNVDQLYQTIYALDSYELVHGGLGALDRYLNLGERPQIVVDPNDAELGWQKGTLAALLTIDLARPVWRLVGLKDQRLEQISSALRDANRRSYYGSD
jgi:hypothetical protein